MTLRARLAIAMVAAAALATLPAVEASAAPNWTKNCTELNKKYAHGVGKRGAHDHTRGTPVRSFKKSNNLYNFAMDANGRLDGDKDGIACEKA
jgi:uncharacterized membrane protein